MDLDPIVPTSQSFKLLTDGFECTLHCLDHKTVVQWVNAISDNIRRLLHVERSIKIAEPKADHSFVRLGHVMKGVTTIGSNPIYIQRAFRATYEVYENSAHIESISGFLAVSDWPSRVWFVSRGSGTRLEVSLSQIYNATLEAVGVHPLLQVLSLAIQRNVIAEWRLTFECPLEAEQAKALVLRDKGQNRSSKTGSWFASSEHPQQDLRNSEQTAIDCKAAAWISELKQKFHIPESDDPQMVLTCCIITKAAPSALSNRGCMRSKWFQPHEVELVSGLLAVFNWALVFVADTGVRGVMHQMRMIVMANQMSNVVWDSSTCRLRLYITADNESKCADKPLEFHIVENGESVAACLDELKSEGPTWLLRQTGLRRGLSTPYLEGCVDAECGAVAEDARWQGHSSTRQCVHLWRAQYPDTAMLDPEASADQMPTKVEIYGYDTHGFQLVTPADWRGALDNCIAVQSSRDRQLHAILEHIECTQHNSVQVVTQKLSALAEHGFPPQVRGELWTGCTFAMTKARLAGSGYYYTLVQEVTRIEHFIKGGNSNDAAPQTLWDALDQIHKDIDNDRTDSSHCLMYRRNGLSPGDLPADRVPAYGGLSDAVRRVCCAFAMRNHSSTGFAQGMPSIVLHLLLVLPEEEAFWLMCCIFEDMLPDHMGYKGSNTGMCSVHDVGKEACKTLLEVLHCVVALCAETCSAK